MSYDSPTITVDDLPPPGPVITLEYNPYMEAFLNARRLVLCSSGCSAADGFQLSWSILEGGMLCPSCGAKGVRGYYRMFVRAGRQSGKTVMGSLSAVEEMIAVPGSKGWCCAPSNPELYDYVIPAFFARLPPELHPKAHPLAHWSADRLVYTAPNGSQAKFRTLDDPNRAVGDTIDWLWMDEARKIDPLAWSLARPMLAVRKGIAWFTSSPDWGEDWCHKNFWLPAASGETGYWACTFKSIDNPVTDPKFIERERATMPPDLFRREYEASIEFPSGTFFGDLVDVVAADDDKMREWIPEWPMISPAREVVIGIDPGTDHPFAGCAIVPCPQGLAVVAEYLERRLTFMQHAQNLKAMVVGVPTRWAMQKFGGDAQAAIELTQHGIYAQVLPGGPGSVQAGIQRMYAWMTTRRMRVSTTKCPRLILEMRKYRMAEVKETPKGLPKDAEPYKKDDDLVSACRYAVQLLPELPSSVLAAPTEVELAMQDLPWWQQLQAKQASSWDEDSDGDQVRVTDDWTSVSERRYGSDESPMGDFNR